MTGAQASTPDAAQPLNGETRDPGRWLSFDRL